MKKKDLAKEKKILDATVQIIIDEGAAAISTTKVAKKVGISQSNIYLYFKDKRTLLDGVYLREIDRLQETTDMKRMFDSTQSITLRVLSYLKALYDFSLANPHSLYVIEQIKLLSKDFPDYIEKLMGTNNPVAALFETGVKTNVLRPINRSLSMAVIFGVIKKHTENLQTGIYTENDVSFAEVSHMIWGAIAIVPYPADLLA